MLIFDPTFKPCRAGLPTQALLLADRLFYQRRALGLNVQFVRQDGRLDEFSLATAERRNGFVAMLQRTGTDYAVSGPAPHDSGKES